MKHLTDAVDMSAKLAEIGSRRAAWREARVKRFGFAPDVTCPNCGDTGTVPDGPPDHPCYCAAGEERRTAAEREAAWAARCPKRFRSYTLDGHPSPSAIEAARAWLERGRPLGANLLLLGSVGTGKTGLAIGVMRELFSDGIGCRFGTVPDLLDGLRPRTGPDGRPDPTSGSAGLRALTTVDVLLMDDLGAEKASEWQAETLYKLVNTRYEEERPTIVTTNRTLDDLDAAVGPRTMSRLVSGAALVHVGGPDRRLLKQGART